MAYSRLVDFVLQECRQQVIKEAHLTGAIVLTPKPHHHALLAKKSNLVLLSHPKALARLDTTLSDIECLAALPATPRVSPENSVELWMSCKSLFFKLLAGHGGNAVYRGDKLTKSVWDHIDAGGYVAQSQLLTGKRTTHTASGCRLQKMDVRLCTYDGEMLLAAARLYQGQTTTSGQEQADLRQSVPFECEGHYFASRTR